MKFLALTLLFLTLLISGCSNRHSNAVLIGAESHSTTDAVLKDEQVQGDNRNLPSSAGSPEQTSKTEDATKTISIEPATLLDEIRISFSMPDLRSPYVEDYEKWSAEHPTYLTNLFARAEPYLAYIYQETQKRGLPSELVLLPAVESAYNPKAISRSKAAGIWQFIPATGRHFGLNQDWWHDGRLDIVRSTDAALTYLEQLNKMFDGDWWLTLAAYNAGPGTVRRAIAANKRKGEPTDYQSLALRSETVRYVPKLIALKNIISRPYDFNVQLPDVSRNIGFREIELAYQIDLRQFAKHFDYPLSKLKHLNPAHKRWATAPGSKQILLLPNHSKFDDALEVDNALIESKVSYQRHKIERGDSLGKLARRYGVSIQALKKANNLKNSRIRAGKILMVPVAEPIDSYTIAATSELATTNTSVTNERIHTVQSGDTLWSISERYQVGVQELMEWNQLDVNSILSLNQRLRVLVR